MTLEYYIMGGVMSLLVGLVIHLLTKDRMNDKFTSEMSKLRDKFSSDLTVMQEKFFAEVAKIQGSYLLKFDHDLHCGRWQEEVGKVNDEAFGQIKSLRDEMQAFNKTLARIEGRLENKGLI